jgi:sodium-coupled neutral amino acid transporter 11
VAGIGLVCLCRSPDGQIARLLVETAKRSSATSYETTMEAAFGRNGFLFVCINMFIMSYGAMVSYLMIVKDTLPYVLGVTD